jgi:galactokinase
MPGKIDSQKYTEFIKIEKKMITHDLLLTSMVKTEQLMDLKQLTDLFFSLYGMTLENPRLFFAPGRVNLIGEHTDYNDGFVFPCAIQLGTCLLIRKNSEKVIRLFSVNKDLRAEISIEKVNERMGKDWVNYPLGVFSEFSKWNVPLEGFDLLYSGDIPDSAGLSSSASIEMVTAFALAGLLKTSQVSLVELVKLARRAENDFVGVSCGIMDQFAVGLSEADHALFLNCKTLEYKAVPLALQGYSLVIGNTNKNRGLADSKYNERVAECQLAVTYLNEIFPVSKLGEISFMQFYKIQEKIPDEVIRKRARHVISENQRVLNAVSCLMKGDLLQFGALMNVSHESLRDNYEVTGPELDAMVEAAWKINGVIGARMTGAGFGGCTVSIVKDDVVEQFILQVGEVYHRSTGLKADFYMAEPSSGVKEIKLQI